MTDLQHHSCAAKPHFLLFISFVLSKQQASTTSFLFFHLNIKSPSDSMVTLRQQLACKGQLEVSQSDSKFSRNY